MSRNVLLTGASRRLDLVNAFHRAARDAGGNVVIAEHDPHAPAPCSRVHLCRVSPPDEPDYVEQVFALARVERAGVIVPVGDAELRPLARASSRFALARIAVAVSPADTIAICRDAVQLGRTLARHGIPVAEGPQRLDGSMALHVVCDLAGQPVSIAAGDAHGPDADELVRRCADALPFVGAFTIHVRVSAGRLVATRITPRLHEAFPLDVADGKTVADLLVPFAESFKFGGGDPISQSRTATGCPA